MALTPEERSRIYQKLVPYLGEHDAEVFLAQYPFADPSQLVEQVDQVIGRPSNGRERSSGHPISERHVLGPSPDA